LDSTIGFELEFSPKGSLCEVCGGTGTIAREYEWDSERNDCDFCGDTGIAECPTCCGGGEILCSYCNGVGCSMCGSGYLQCPDCDGECCIPCPECKGKIRITNDDECDTYYHNITCPTCDGIGSSLIDPEVMFNQYGEFKVEATVTTPNNEIDGGEFASHILKSYDEIKKCVSYLLNQIEDIADSKGELNCGLHIHIAPRNGWSHSMIRKLIIAWASWGESMFLEEFYPDKQRLKLHCKEWTCKDDICDLDNIYPEDSDFINQVLTWNSDIDRDATMNLFALKKHGTIEFRLFDGTMDEIEILQAISWVINLVESLNEKNVYAAFYAKVARKDVA
jgi:hypothetical protein